MAGSNSAFNATTFRTAIRDTMLMGSPNTVADRATFKWSPKNKYAVADSNGMPYSWKSPIQEPGPAGKVDTQIPVAVEYVRGAATDANPVGKFDVTKIILTILDDDYALVEGADQVEIGGELYKIDYVEPPQGLFSVDVYTAHARSYDAS